MTVVNGEDNNTLTVSAGDLPSAVAPGLLTNKAYVVNYATADVTVKTPVQVASIPLATTIQPLPDDRSVLPDPILSLIASSTCSPVSPAVRQIYYQLDTRMGEWSTVNPVGAATWVQEETVE